MIFHIPKQRIKGGPMIYPEYRLHSIVFALRSVVCYYLTYHGLPKIYNIGVCVVTMGLADITTYMYPSGTTTMRQMTFDPGIDETKRKYIIMMQSFHQIGATLYMVGNEDACFSPMFAIQIAAFLMTLVRKSIIHPTMWHLVYNLSLWINVFCYNSLPIRYIIIHPVLCQLFYYWRFSGDRSVPKLFVGNKYVGWTIVFATFYVCVSNKKMLIGFNNTGNNIMMIRYALITIYLVSNIYRSRGLLVLFCRKTD